MYLLYIRKKKCWRLLHYFYQSFILYTLPMKEIYLDWYVKKCRTFLLWKMQGKKKDLFEVKDYNYVNHYITICVSTALAFPIWPKSTNPGLFQIRFQHILARRAKMYWNLIWKSPGFVPFWANRTHFGLKSDTIGIRAVCMIR